MVWGGGLFQNLGNLVSPILKWLFALLPVLKLLLVRGLWYNNRLSLRVDINDLDDVLQLLKKCDFPDSKWMELGLKLGLKKNTLDTIEANNPRDVSRCLIECLSKWLERADDVDSKGGATWDSLSDALRSMDEIAVADKLDQESEWSLY